MTVVQATKIVRLRVRRAWHSLLLIVLRYRRRARSLDAPTLDVRHHRDLRLPLGRARRAIARSSRRSRSSMRPRGPDAGGTWISAGRPRRARQPAAGDHRPLDEGTQPMFDVGARAGDRLQRRDLQPPRAARVARARRRAVPLADRHRSAPAALSARRRGDARTAARHVRLRHLGRARAADVRRARSVRHQAALLRRRRRRRSASPRR